MLTSLAGSNRVFEINSQVSQFQQQRLKKLMMLQGQCKIVNIKTLKLNMLKAIFLSFFAFITIIGFLMMVWFRWFRVKLWFSQCDINEATHVYVKGIDNDAVQKVVHQGISHLTFFFNKLKYAMKGNIYYPVAIDYESILLNPNYNQYLSRGLSSQEVLTQRQAYGSNEHSVQIPNYFRYMVDVLLKPFFLMQYLVCVAYIVEGYKLFAILNLIFSLITTTINYILLYISFRKIKQMAEKVIDVKVLRDSTFRMVKSSQLVPGDIIQPQGQMMCDCIVVHGDIYVNEASLTGQNIPIGKFSVTSIKQLQENSSWLFQGSKVVQKRGQVLALVVYTGYASRRGRLIRKILTRKSKSSVMFKRALLFLIEAVIVSIIIYLATIAYTKQRNVVDLIVGFRFIDFLGWGFPPSLPIFFNVAYSYTLVRLKNKGILCTQPQKTIQGTHLKVMCFDKTGTLTQNVVEVNQVFKFQNSNSISDITKYYDYKQNDLIWKLFATCHTTIKTAEGFVGDEIDLRMFLFSNYQMRPSQDPNVKFESVNPNRNHYLQVLRINQFQSRFQSMSVLVRDRMDNRYYVFVKGAPEKMHNNSILKINSFDNLIKSISLNGYRTIAFGCKPLQASQVGKYLSEPRQTFQANITILGLVSFENKLKNDTRQTIRRLVKSGIQTKIITGDNIYIAIQTGVRAGVIDIHDDIVILQGKRQELQMISQNKRIFKGRLLMRRQGQIFEQQVLVNEGQNYQNKPIAVDNDFIKLYPAPVLTSNMKLFARISPQNKALIVKSYKQIINQQYSNNSFINTICGDMKRNVGMCGDGANDLMAIRESDVGIGINNSDASYAAMFAITRLLDVEEIVRDSKATTTNIIQMILYYQFISFIKIPASLLMLTDTANFSDNQITYYSFTSTIIYPIFMPMSRPSNIITSSIPNSNLFSPLGHLQFWGSLIIGTAGLSAGYFYFKQTPIFIPNPRPVVVNDWYQYTHSGTCMFLLIIIYFSVYPLVYYISYPWKKPIYRNYILFILILLNTAAAILLYYITSQAEEAFKFVPIKRFDIVSVLLAISIGSCIISYVYNQILIKIFNSGNGSEQQIQQLQEIKY